MWPRPCAFRGCRTAAGFESVDCRFMWSCWRMGQWMSKSWKSCFFTFLDGAQKLYRECKGQPSWGSQHTTGQVCIQSLFLMSASAPVGDRGARLVKWVDGELIMGKVMVMVMSRWCCCWWWWWCWCLNKCGLKKDLAQAGKNVYTIISSLTIEFKGSLRLTAYYIE